MTTTPVRTSPAKTRSSRSRPAPLLVLSLAFTVLVAMHTAFTPVFEAPDEVWHYAYVRWVAEGYGLPSLSDDASGAYQEAAQPPLYYLAAALISRPFADDDLAALQWHNPGFGTQAPGTLPDNKGMLIHTRAEAWPWRGAALAIHATRLASWLFGLLTVVAAWGLGRTALGDRRGALLTAGLVAFQPQFVFLSSVVSNDSAAAAIATLALWLGLAMVMGPARHSSPAAGGRPPWTASLPVQAAGLGMLAGLGALTKTSLLLLTPLGAGLVVLAALRRSPDSSTRRTAARTAQALVLFGVSVAAIAGWWYARNLVRYGDPLGLTQHTETPWGRGTPASLIQLLPEAPLVLRSFWAAYGWGHVTWPNGVYVALWAAALIVLGVATVALVRGWVAAVRRWGLRAPWRLAGPEAAALLAGGVGALWCAGVAVALVRWMQQVQAPHGRLLFPALGAWALLLALGIRAVGDRQLRGGSLPRMAPRASGQRSPAPGRARLSRIAAGGLLGAGAVLAALAPGARIAAAFAPPRLRAPEAIAASCSHPVDVTYGGVARLLCVEVSPDRVHPEDVVTVRACWTALAPMTADYTVFAHLLGPDEARVAERHTYPGLGRFPTSLWPVGKAFCDNYRLTVEPWAEAPLTYRLAVGLFDAESGARLAATGASGQPFEPPLVGEVTVGAPPDAAAPAPQWPVAADFADGAQAVVALTGYDAPDAMAAGVSAGTAVTVTLHWRAIAAPPADYVAFVHLRRPGEAEPVAQADGQPRGGWYATSRWATGDVVLDPHTLQLPPDLAPGSYALWAGLYRATDITRLAATGPDGPYPDDLVPLGTVEVRSN